MVLAFHGGGGNATQWKNSNPWHETAARHGFVVVFMQGCKDSLTDCSKVSGSYLWTVGKKDDGKTIDDQAYVLEALKRLEYSRLVSIRQGSGVKVLDYLAHAGLEFVTTMFGAKANSQNEMVADLVQARAIVGEAIYHHAIDHFNPEALESLRESIDDLAAEAEKARPDVRRLQEFDFEVQHRLLRGGKNRTIVLLHNSIRYIYGGIAHLFEPLVEKPHTLVEQYRRLLADLESGNRRGAKQIITVIFAVQQLAMARRLPGGS